MKTPVLSSENTGAIRIVSSIGDRVTLRAVILALILAVINDYWIVQLEVVRYSFATYAAPFYNCVFTLLVVTALNLLVRRVSPQNALRRMELLTIYAMVSITSAVCSHNMMEILVSLMGYAFQFKSPENNWDRLFIGRLPSWLTVRDPIALRGFYNGNTSLYESANFMPWLIPILCWSAFCAVLIFTMLCINSILRKQWMDSERLTFPVIMLPLEMTEETGSLFKNKYMWLGFAIAGTLTFLAGLNYLYPSVPHLRIVRRDIGQYVTTPPWNAMGGIPLGFYFWAIGIAFLMPLEMSFSCWIFYWLVKLELVGCQALGLNELRVMGGGFDTGYPYLNSQSYGAYLGFFVTSMWASRHYIRRVFRTAFLRSKEEDESGEAISYRTAILGLISGLLFLCFFAYQIGMSLWVISTFFVLYFVFAVIISRIRAEIGFPTHDMHVMGPQHLVLTAAGTENVPSQDLVGFSLFYWFNRTYASHPAPHQLESYKLAEKAGSPARQMFWAMLIAGTLAMPIGFWMLLHTYYRLGGATARMEGWALGFGASAWNTLANWLTQPTPPNKTALLFVGVGFAISTAMSWVRLRFQWFPFHPLAYAISNSWGVSQLWMPLLIGSTAKFFTLRFGGLKTYRRFLPFFFGLILGEITVGSLWSIIGIVLGIPTYDFWPGKYG